MSSEFLTPLLDTFDAGACRTLAERMARARMWQVPTLVIWRLWATSTSLPGNSEDRAARQRLFATYRRMVQIMHESGVPIAVGTDEHAPFPDEMELLVGAGLSPIAALRAATIDAAECLGVANSHGSVARGKIANFILVKDNPVADIRSLRQIEMVVLQGRRFDKNAIAQWVASKLSAQDKPK